MTGLRQGNILKSGNNETIDSDSQSELGNLQAKYHVKSPLEEEPL